MFINIRITAMLLLVLNFTGLHIVEGTRVNLYKPFLSKFTSISSHEKCYDGLGCVKLTPEWYHPVFRSLNYLPLDRHAINTIFVAWNLSEGNVSSSIIGTNEFNNFKIQKSLKLLIHDFTSNGYTGWIQHLARAYLMTSKQPDLNVVSIDWVAGAEPPYAQAVANARLVALEAVQFLTQCGDKNTITKTDIHIIGHGLGAHIAGYIGKMTEVNRITALNPTGPYFTGMPSQVRLNSNDAEYVEVIHSHVQPHGQGYKNLLGHVDFYPNDGKKQPGCHDTFIKLSSLKRGDLKLGQTLSACSHKRSIKYYIEALVNPSCSFVGISCPSFKDFLRGKCSSCGEYLENCAQLNPSQEQQTALNHSTGFYFITADAAPFCGEMFKVSLLLESKLAEPTYFKGFFTVVVPQSTGDVKFALNENQSLSALRTNERYTFLVFRSTPPHLVLPASTIKIRWLYTHRIHYTTPAPPSVSSLTIEKITMDRGSKNNVYQFFKSDSNQPENSSGDMKLYNPLISTVSSDTAFLKKAKSKENSTFLNDIEFTRIY